MALMGHALLRVAQVLSPAWFTDMNRLPSIDSKQSLDDGNRVRESGAMISQRYQLYIERTDTEKNVARFYAISIEPDLFGEACLMRRWGRIGSRGRVLVHHFERERDAVILFLDLLRRKRSRGYKTVPKKELERR